MRVLFIPLAGSIAHCIPLIVLNKMLDKVNFKTAFLLPQSKHQVMASKFGVDIINLDYQYNSHSFRTEMRAYKLFSPDVVIDDTNLVTGLATALANLPRVTIQRTGLFPGSIPCDSNYEFSLKYDLRQIPNLSFMGLQQPQKLSDFFSANCKIVPGIPSIEQLPPSLSHDSTYYFSGPLLLEDYMTNEVSTLPIHQYSGRSAEKDFTLLESFFAIHVQRKRIYITTGTVANTDSSELPHIRSCIRRLLQQKTAIVTNIIVDNLNNEDSKYYFRSDYLPMNYVCRNVDLMIHQCGSATYHYPIMHQLPMITIGTRTTDRDGVARRLQELGVNMYLKSPEECPDFEEMLLNSIERFYENGALGAQIRQRMTALNDEIIRTSAAFNLEEVLLKAVKS